MAYSTELDIINYFPKAVLIQLTDDAGIGEVDVDKVNDAIRRADNLIDSYLNGRYTTPIPAGSVPNEIEDISTQLAIYFLYKRALTLTLPDTIKDNYKEAITYLKEIQKGKLSPFSTGANPTWAVGNKVGQIPLTVQAMQSPDSPNPNFLDRFYI